MRDKNVSGDELYVLFEACGFVLAAAYNNVKEVIPYMEPVTVPDAPPEIAGVINYNGRICPVILLSAFAPGDTPHASASCLIMFEYPGNPAILIAVFADRFIGGARINNAGIKLLLHSGDALRPGFSESARVNDADAVIFRPFVFFKTLDFIRLN